MLLSGLNISFPWQCRYLMWVLLMVFSRSLLAQTNPDDSIQVDSNWNQITQRIVIGSHQLGDIQHPFELIKGRTIGMHITQPASNPFDPFVIRTRGQNTLLSENTSPRILLDHMPVENIKHYSIFNLTGAEIRADAGSNAIHGLRGMQGSVDFLTSQLTEDNFMIKYFNNFSTISTSRATPVFSASEFIQQGGTNLGSNTDFQEEIIQKSSAQQHFLSIGKKWRNTQLEASGHFRKLLPILKNTVSTTLYSRLSISQTFFQDRLILNWKNYLFKGQHEYGEPAAFHYADIFNPTSPIRTSNLNEFGGYFEEIYFNYYNPVSIVENNHHSGSETGSLNQLNAQISLNSALSIQVNYGLESSILDQRRWVPATSFFTGYGSNGYVNTSNSEAKNEWLDIFLQHKFKFANLSITGKSGYNRQEVRKENRIIDANDFSTTVNESTLPESGANRTSSARGIAYRLIGFYTQNQISFKNYLRSDLTVIYNGSSRLGANKRWGIYYGFNAVLNLNEVLQSHNRNSFSLHAGLGKVGNIPPADNLAVYVIDSAYTDIYYNGDFINNAEYRHAANPDLRGEQKSELSFGLKKGFWNNRLMIYYQAFFNKSSELITNEYIFDLTTAARTKWQNTSTIINRGWELSLNLDIIQNKNFTWNTNLVAYRFQSKLTEAPEFRQNIGSRCGCGKAYAPYYIVRGEKLGELRTWQESYDGNQFHEVDLNNDGLDFKDYRVAGSIYPKLILGIQNEIQFRKLTASIRISGARGHLIGNENRLLYEVTNLTQFQNIVRSKYYTQIPNNSNVFSDRFAEKGSYLRIDQLFLSYDLSNLTKSIFSDLSLIIGSSNLLIFTGYSGIDPEVRYEEPIINRQNNLRNYSALTGGFESQYTYPVTRSFFIGLQATFTK